MRVLISNLGSKLTLNYWLLSVGCLNYTDQCTMFGTQVEKCKKKYLYESFEILKSQIKSQLISAVCLHFFRNIVNS